MNPSSSSLPKILLIDHHPDTRRYLQARLSPQFQVMLSEQGWEGLQLARDQVPDLILLDASLPVFNGLGLCSLMKKEEKLQTIPILLFLTQHLNPTQAIQCGADDWVFKPLDFNDLVTRIQKNLTLASQKKQAVVIVSGSLTFIQLNREVIHAQKKVKLTPTEFKLLRHLVLKKDQIVTRDEILREVWNHHLGSAQGRTIDVHIRAIRRKISSLSQHIVSIYGVGYQFRE
ncbi:MAG: response regulator transcription factor [Bdellovibrionia bacterium]